MSERTIRAGDHLWVWCVAYSHHGIATGPNSVVQYLGKKGVYADGLIAETSLDAFHEGAKVHVKDHPDRLHGRTQSVLRARQRVGESEYNLAFNNCEHFVNWCIEDEHTSEQVNNMVRTAGHTAVGLWGSRLLTARTVTDAVMAGRTAETVRAAVSIAPSVASAFTTSAPAAASFVAPLASGLGAAGATVLGGAGAAAVGLTAPVSVPLIAVATGIGLAVSALWSMFD